MSEQPGPGQGTGPRGDDRQDPAPPPGYLIPSDAERGVSSDRDSPPPPPQTPQDDPPAHSGPAFTLPSSEPDSPVSGTSGAPPAAGGYGAQRRADTGQRDDTSGIEYQQQSGGFGQSGPQPSYGTGGPTSQTGYGQQSAPPSYQQSAPPSYQQSGYQQGGPQQGGQGAQHSAIPAYGQQQASAPPSHPQTAYPNAPVSGYAQPNAAGYSQAAGYGAYPQSGQPQYGVALPPTKPPNNGVALGAMITGIGSSVMALGTCCVGLASILGILAGAAALVMGIMARKQIQQPGAQSGGSGMALAGIITGACGAGLSLIGLALYLAGVAMLSANNF